MKTLPGFHRLFKIPFLLWLLLFLAIFGCSGGSELEITGGDNRMPIEVKLVHGTLLVVKAVANDSTTLDMLLDTGSSRTLVPSKIFGNSNGEVYISSLCLENGLCFNKDMQIID